jgi:hypothetical protein
VLVLKEAAEEKRALWFISWTVNAPEAGIYRFEISPFETAPFLLQQHERQFLPMYRHILINDILLKGQDSVWYDPSILGLMPVRFRVPLNQGVNRISGLISAKAGTSIQPRLYGIHNETTQKNGGKQ